MEDRRKSTRFRIPFTVEVIPSIESTEYVTGEIRDFSPDGFSFEAKEVSLEINSSVKARFQIHPDSDYIVVLGRVVWKIQFGIDCQVGIEVQELNTGTSKNLGFPFNMWEDKITNS